MSRFGLVGPSYTLANIDADDQATINWYISQVESGAGNAPLAMDPTPGTRQFVDLGREVTPATPGVGAFDKNDGGTIGNDTTSTVGATISPAEATEWAFGILNGIISGSTQTFTPDPGWSGGPGSGGIQQIVTGPINVQGTWGLHCYWAECMVLFKLIGTSSLPSTVQAPLTGTSSVPITAGPFVSPLTAGNTVICTIQGAEHDSATGSFTVSDGVNTWVRLASAANTNEGGSTTGPLLEIWAAFNVAAGSPTFTVTGPTLSGGGFFFGEYAAGHAAVTNSGPVRGLFTVTGRTFAVCGSDFDEILGNGTFITRGTVGNDSLPVTMAASPQQLLLASAGTAYVFDLMANTLTAIPGVTFAGPVSQAGICDGFFLLTIQNSKEFYVSAPLDAMDWVTNGAAIVSVFADNIVSMLVHDREIWFWSDRDRTVYYDSGNIFPFDVIAGTTIQAGSAAKNSPARIDDRVLWLNADDNGTATVKMGSGYTPQRISNHALEFAMQGYARVDDAVGTTYQDQGHNFYELYFPTPSVTWVFDTLTGMWHQRAFWLEQIGQYQAAHRWNHTYNFGKHLVGDWQSGKVYEMRIPTQVGSAWTFADDDGNTIRRMRRAPHISKEQKWAFYHFVNVFVEAGLGPIPPLATPAPYPTFVVLEDVNTPGTFWLVTIADDGTLNAVITDGPATEVFVNDPFHPGQSYQLYVNTGPTIVVGSEIPFNASYPEVFLMATITTQLSTGLRGVTL